MKADARLFSRSRTKVKVATRSDVKNVGPLYISGTTTVLKLKLHVGHGGCMLYPSCCQRRWIKVQLATRSNVINLEAHISENTPELKLKLCG